jgi:hypothetical protein
VVFKFSAASMGITAKIYFQQPPKVIAVKNWAIFTSHLKLPKVILFWAGTAENQLYFWLNIFGDQILSKIGHYC